MSDENNVDNKMVKLKLIIAHGKCLNCGYKRTLYFTSDYTYGERIVSSQSGMFCAYANLLGDNIMQELEKSCEELYNENGIKILSTGLKRIIPNIYGITCDEINGERIDTIPNTKCPKCLGKKLIEDAEFGEQIKEIDAYIVTHNSWESLKVIERKEKIKQELIRQEYLK